MRALVQRVSRAEVRVAEQVVGGIGAGLLVLLGVGEGDGDREAELLADKVVNLRIFADDQGKMNRSLLAIGGGALVVSQFTLYGDVRKGRRPSFVRAAAPDEADRLYAVFVSELRRRAVPVETGVFQAQMQVELVNDGPVTIWIDTADLSGGK